MSVSRQEVIQTAEKLVARGRLQAAISEYRKVLESAPNDTSMLNRVGDLYARLNQVDKATRLFRQTAENFARQGFFVKAIAIYKKIIRLDPSQIAAYESLAGLYARQGLTNEAIGQYQVVADYFLKHDDRTAAAGIYRAMIGVDSENPRYRLRLAGLLRERGDLAGALEQYHEIASLMLVHGRIEEAAQVYTSALDVDSTDTVFLARAVTALREAGNDSGAERLFDLVAERSADTAAATRAELERADRQETIAIESTAEEAGRPFWMAQDEAEVLAETGEEEGFGAFDEIDDGAGELVLDLDGPELRERLGSLSEPPVPSVETPGLGIEVDDVSELEFELEVEEPVALEAVEPVDAEAEPSVPLEVADADAEHVRLGTPPSDTLEEPIELEESGGPEGAAELEAVVELELELEDEEVLAETANGAVEEVVEAAAEHPPLEGPAPAVAVSEAAGELAASEPAEEGSRDEAGSSVAGAAVTEAEAEEEPAVDGSQPAEVAAVEDAAEAEEIGTAVSAVAAGAPGPETPDRRPTEISDRARDLMTEATVLSKYGMDEMAAACLEEALELDPDQVEAQGRLIHIQLSLGRRDEALIMANRFAGLVAEGGEPAIWEQVVARMAAEGFELEDGRFVGTAISAVEELAQDAAAPEVETEFEQPEEWLDEVEEEVEEAARQEARAAAEAEAEAALTPVAGPEDAGEVEPPVPLPEATGEVELEEAELEEAVESGRGSVEVDTRRDILDIATAVRRRPAEGGRPAAVTPAELLAGAEELTWDEEKRPTEPEIAAAPAGAAPNAADEETAELDLAAMAKELEAAAERFAASLGPVVPPMPEGPVSGLPENEVEASPELPLVPWSDEQALGADEFFDLATELEAELLDADLEDDLLPPVQEQTIEEIVEGFRRGMEKSLSVEDFDTHYNLGIAYQEMGLVDEAIGEFQLAAKDSRYLVECCSLLAGCFQSKGYPELAVHWYERGLASPSVREDERLGLLYELGNLEIAIGKRESARERFVELYGISSTYRDVVAKLEELGRRPS